MEWCFMLPGIDLPFFRLRQVDGIGWRLMLYFIDGHLLVHSDGHIPWIFRPEVSGMVGKYL